MKADRLVSILLLLQSAERRTARDLAERLEVSERTIYRDVEALSASGVPVYAERGAEGGILLSEGYRKALMHFGDDEIRSLFVSGSEILADLGMDGGRDRALEKLRGAFSDVQRRAAEKARARILVDQRRWTNEEPPREILAALRRAVWDDRRARIRYADRGGKPSTRTIDPLGLVAKAGVWYLVARWDGEYRSFRVDRIRDAQELSDHFERPDGFELEQHWRESTTQLLQRWPTSYPVVLRVSSHDFEKFGSYFPSETIADEGELILVRVRFPSCDVAIAQVISLGVRLMIVEPQELRELVMARARDVLEWCSADY